MRKTRKVSITKANKQNHAGQTKQKGIDGKTDGGKTLMEKTFRWKNAAILGGAIMEKTARNAGPGMMENGNMTH